MCAAILNRTVDSAAAPLTVGTQTTRPEYGAAVAQDFRRYLSPFCRLCKDLNPGVAVVKIVKDALFVVDKVLFDEN